MENFDELLKKYADFIVRVGVNPQPGQTLIINCPLEGAPLARLCVRSAYEAGARDVQVNWSDDAVARARMELSISAPDAVIPAGPLTRVYISSSETLYDVGQLYKNIRSSITGSYPLASLLLPDWSLGSYISQAQLASLLGVDTTATSLQDMTEFELPQKKLQRVQPENAKDGYLYFQLDTGDASANAPVLVIGLEKSRFFADAIPVHILLTIPEHGVSIQLTGTVSAQTVVLTAPTSRMKDEDIQTLVQIRDTIQSVLQFVQTAANGVQNAG